MEGRFSICFALLVGCLLVNIAHGGPRIRSRTSASRFPRQVGGVLQKNLDKIASPGGPYFVVEKSSNPLAAEKLQGHFQNDVEANNDDKIFFGRDPSNLPGEEVGDSPYRWRVIIDWNVDNEISLQYMGQLEIYLPAYEWTLGYYYWLRPDGHLQEVFYNSRPDYGFRNEVFVIRDYLPQNWVTNKVDYSQYYPAKSDAKASKAKRAIRRRQ